VLRELKFTTTELDAQRKVDGHHSISALLGHARTRAFKVADAAAAAIFQLKKTKREAAAPQVGQDSLLEFSFGSEEDDGASQVDAERMKRDESFRAAEEEVNHVDGALDSTQASRHAAMAGKVRAAVLAAQRQVRQQADAAERSITGMEQQEHGLDKQVRQANEERVAEARQVDIIESEALAMQETHRQAEQEVRKMKGGLAALVAPLTPK